jgi:Lhr-like helicase
MNKNLELVQKSLDTISPGWQTVLVATVTDSGFEYDIFNKIDEDHAQENLAVLLALVIKKSQQELEQLDWSEN